MNAVHQRLNYLEASFDIVEDLVSRHATELATHNSRLIALETQLAAIDAFLAELAEKVPREREPLPRLPDLRPGIVIPDFDPRLPLKEDKKTEALATPPEKAIGPRSIDGVPAPIVPIHVNKEETLPPSIVQDLRPRVTIPDLGPIIHINDKDKNGNNDI